MIANQHLLKYIYNITMLHSISKYIQGYMYYHLYTSLYEKYVVFGWNFGMVVEKKQQTTEKCINLIMLGKQHEHKKEKLYKSLYMNEI